MCPIYNSNLDAFLKTMTVTGASTTLASGGSTAINFSYSVPSGYIAIGVVGYYTGAVSVFPLRISNKRMDVRNVATTENTFTPTLTVLLMKSL